MFRHLAGMGKGGLRENRVVPKRLKATRNAILIGGGK